MRTAPILLLALAACAHAGGPTTARPSRGGDPLAGVPGEAAVVLVLSSPRPLMDTGASAWLLGDARAAALVDDVDGYLRRRTGLSLRRVRSGAAYLLPDGKLAAIVHEVGGGPTGGGLVTLDAATVMARSGDDLVVGAPEAVRLSLDVLAARARPLSAGRPALARLLGDELAAGAFLLAGAEVAALAGGPMALPPGIGVDRGVASLRSGAARAILQGPPRALPGIADQIRTILRTAAATVTREREQKVEHGELPEAVGAIIADHYLRALAEALDPKVAGDRITSELPLGGAQATSVAVVGVLAAIAIPAFMKYTEKAKAKAATSR